MGLGLRLGLGLGWSGPRVGVGVEVRGRVRVFGAHLPWVRDAHRLAEAELEQQPVGGLGKG